MPVPDEETRTRFEAFIAKRAPDDLRETVVFYGKEDELLMLVRGEKFTPEHHRLLLHVLRAQDDPPLGVVVLFHSRALETHQMRVAFFEVVSQDSYTAIVRGGEISAWTDTTKKDMRFFTLS